MSQLSQVMGSPTGVEIVKLANGTYLAMYTVPAPTMVGPDGRPVQMVGCNQRQVIRTVSHASLDETMREVMDYLHEGKGNACD